MDFEPIIPHQELSASKYANTVSTLKKPLHFFSHNFTQFLTSWWWVNFILLIINISNKQTKREIEWNGTFRRQQVLLRYTKHNERSISMHLLWMSSNSTIVACILAHYICIVGILLLPFCSIFDQKNYLQTWAPSSAHAASFIFFA